MYLDKPTKISDIPKCKTCKFCNITTSKQSGEWGQDVWVKHHCEMFKEDVDYNSTCIHHKIPKSYNQLTTSKTEK